MSNVAWLECVGGLDELIRIQNRLDKELLRVQNDFSKVCEGFKVEIIESGDSSKMVCLEWVEDVIFRMRCAENDGGCVLDIKDMCPIEMIVNQNSVKM